jgi:hypothetical protein
VLCYFKGIPGDMGDREVAWPCWRTSVGSRDRLVFGYLKVIPGDTGDREAAMLQAICRKQGQVSVLLLIGDTKKYGGQGGGHAAGHL